MAGKAQKRNFKVPLYNPKTRESVELSVKARGKKMAAARALVLLANTHENYADFRVGTPHHQTPVRQGKRRRDKKVSIAPQRRAFGITPWWMR